MSEEYIAYIVMGTVCVKACNRDYIILLGCLSYIVADMVLDTV